MAKSKSIKEKKGKGSGGGAQQFFLWHGEKFVVVVIVVVALWFSMQGLGYLGQTVSWQPSDLEASAGEAEQAIKASTRTAEDEEMTPFDYAAYAEQIKQSVSADPYRARSVWNPVVSPRSSGSQRSSGMGSTL